MSRRSISRNEYNLRRAEIRVGLKIGRLTITAGPLPRGRNRKSLRWAFRCECGAEGTITPDAFRHRYIRPADRVCACVVAVERPDRLVVASRPSDGSRLRDCVCACGAAFRVIKPTERSRCARCQIVARRGSNVKRLLRFGALERGEKVAGYPRINMHEDPVNEDLISRLSRGLGGGGKSS